MSLHKTKDKDRKCTGEKREASHERDAECTGRSTHRPQHAQAAARTSCSVYELEHPHVTAPKLQHTSCSTQVAAHESQHTSCSTQAAAHNTPRHPSLPATRQPSPPPPPSPNSTPVFTLVNPQSVPLEYTRNEKPLMLFFSDPARAQAELR